MAVTNPLFASSGRFQSPRLYRCLVLLLFFASAGKARAQEHYFVLIFSSQRDGPSPNYSHTWATFVKATQTQSRGCILEAHTISWLPENGKIRVAALLPETGRNFDLISTLNWARDTGQHISLWGPYQITCELFEHALAQKRLLESGAVRYKAIDTGRRSDRVSNCIHAVAGVTDGNRLRVTTLRCGESASALVADEMEPWFINSGQIHDWVASALGVGCHCVARRNLELSRRSSFRRW
jgi:hypothetical protein